MKRMLLFMSTITIFYSCKKDWTCQCTYNDNTYNYQLRDIKKSNSDSECAISGNQWIIIGGKCEVID